MQCPPLVSPISSLQPPLVPGSNANPNNPNDVEYRVTVKQKKKQTAACDACKRRRRKCSGTLPCAYCTEKRCECNYSQQHKRGKRKASDNPSPPEDTQITTANLTKAQKLWNEAERYSTVDKFCGIRWWWKNLLDMQGIKQSPNPAYRAQSCIINAWMARIARDHIGARQYYDIARNISLNGFGESDPVSVTTAYLLLSDYAPSEKEYFHYSWKMAETIKPGTSTERHVFIYASSFAAFCYDKDTSYTEMLDRLLSFASTTLQSSVVDLWDTVYFMSVKAYIGLLSKLEKFLCDGYLRSLSKLTLAKSDRDALMTDLRVGEVLMQSQMHMFGFEYQTCLQFTKILLLWAGGERDKAVSESIRFVQNIEQFGENALFLVEVKNLMLPLMILNDMGITTYNNTTVGIIETICKETDQPDMLAELIPLFSDLRLAASSQAPTNNHFLANNITSPLSTNSSLSTYSSLSPHSPLSSSSSSNSPSLSSSEEPEPLQMFVPNDNNNENSDNNDYYLGYSQSSPIPDHNNINNNNNNNAPPLAKYLLPASHPSPLYSSTSSPLYSSSSSSMLMPSHPPYLSTSISAPPTLPTNPHTNPYLNSSTQLHNNSPHPLPQHNSSSPPSSRIQNINNNDYVSNSQDSLHDLRNHPLSGAPPPPSLSSPSTLLHPLSSSSSHIHLSTPSLSNNHILTSVSYPLPPSRVTYDLNWNNTTIPSPSSSSTTPYSDLMSDNNL